MNKNTLPLVSAPVHEQNNYNKQQDLGIKNLTLATGNATMPPKLGKENHDLFGLNKLSHETHSLVQRQSSILSFQNLSVGDCTSVADSQFSHYNPSINEPYVSEDADPAEKEMHRFLDNAGVFRINIKQQIEEEKKSTYSASPSLQRLSGLRMK
jgi:hypothetical protein